MSAIAHQVPSPTTNKVANKAASMQAEVWMKYGIEPLHCWLTGPPGHLPCVYQPAHEWPPTHPIMAYAPCPKTVLMDLTG